MRVLFQGHKASFVHRRKTLWNNLTSYFGRAEEVKTKLERALEKLILRPMFEEKRELGSFALE